MNFFPLASQIRIPEVTFIKKSLLNVIIEAAWERVNYELDLERILWRDSAVHVVVSYNSTRALTEDFLNL